MSLFNLMRALIHVHAVLTLSGDRLHIEADHGAAAVLLADIREHKPVLVDLLASGRLDAALQDAAAYEAMLAEPWEASGWVDADRLLAAVDAFGKRPIKVQHLPLRRPRETPREEEQP